MGILRFRDWFNGWTKARAICDIEADHNEVILIRRFSAFSLNVKLRARDDADPSGRDDYVPADLKIFLLAD